MSDHKQMPARVLTALLIVAAVLASLIGGGGETPLASPPARLTGRIMIARGRHPRSGR